MGKAEDGGRGRKGGREQQLAQGLSGGWCHFNAKMEMESPWCAADGGSSVARQTRCCGACPASMEVDPPPWVPPPEGCPPPWARRCSVVDRHPSAQVCCCSPEAAASLVEEDPSSSTRDNTKGGKGLFELLLGPQACNQVASLLKTDVLLSGSLYL